MSHRSGDDTLPPLLAEPSGRLYAVVWTMACLSGVLAGWAVTGVERTWLNLPVAVWAFLVVWAATSASLSYRRFPSGVAARGLAVAAAFIVLVPLVQFLPSFLLELRARSIDLGALSTELYGLLVWQTLAVLGAVVVVFVSRRFAARAATIRRRRTTRELRKLQ